MELMERGMWELRLVMAGGPGGALFVEGKHDQLVLFVVAK
jgi:hypothetical protein